MYIVPTTAYIPPMYEQLHTTPMYVEIAWLIMSSYFLTFRRIPYFENDKYFICTVCFLLCCQV